MGWSPAASSGGGARPDSSAPNEGLGVASSSLWWPGHERQQLAAVAFSCRLALATMATKERRHDLLGARHCRRRLLPGQRWPEVPGPQASAS